MKTLNQYIQEKLFVRSKSNADAKYEFQLLLSKENINLFLSALNNIWGKRNNTVEIDTDSKLSSHMNRIYCYSDDDLNKVIALIILRWDPANLDNTGKDIKDLTDDDLERHIIAGPEVYKFVKNNINKIDEIVVNVKDIWPSIYNKFPFNH